MYITIGRIVYLSPKNTRAYKLFSFFFFQLWSDFWCSYSINHNLCHHNWMEVHLLLKLTSFLSPLPNSDLSVPMTIPLFSIYPFTLCSAATLLPSLHHRSKSHLLSPLLVSWSVWYRFRQVEQRFDYSDAHMPHFFGEGLCVMWMYPKQRILKN